MGYDIDSNIFTIPSVFYGEFHWHFLPEVTCRQENLAGSTVHAGTRCVPSEFFWFAWPVLSFKRKACAPLSFMIEMKQIHSGESKTIGGEPGLWRFFISNIHYSNSIRGKVKHKSWFVFLKLFILLWKLLFKKKKAVLGYTHIGGRNLNILFSVPSNSFFFCEIVS